MIFSKVLLAAPNKSSLRTAFRMQCITFSVYSDKFYIGIVILQDSTSIILNVAKVSPLHAVNMILYTVHCFTRASSFYLMKTSRVPVSLSRQWPVVKRICAWMVLLWLVLPCLRRAKTPHHNINYNKAHIYNNSTTARPYICMKAFSCINTTVLILN